MRRTISPRSFWNSPRVRSFIIAAARDRWDIPQGTEPWRSLLDEIVRTNNEDQYPRCAYCLFAFVDLLKVFGKQAAKRTSDDWWESVEHAFRDDGQSLGWLRLMKELLASDRSDGVTALTRISRQGITFSLPGGFRQRYKKLDCGVPELVELTRRIEPILDRVHHEKLRSGKTIDVEQRSRMHQVLLDFAGKNRISLQFEKKKISLTPIPSRVVYWLFQERESGPILYEALWEYVYGPGTSYPKTKGGGPPEKLRKQKSEIMELMKVTWDEAPNKQDWIGKDKGSGYFLNRSVKWQYAKGAGDYPPPYFLPHDELERIQKRRDDEA